MEFYTFNSDMYPHCLTVVVGEMDGEAFNTGLRRRRIISREEGFSTEDLDAARHWQKDGFSIIWLKDNTVKASFLSLLAHEAVHAGVGLADHLGITISQDSEEFLAYYVQWVMFKTLQKLWR